MLKLYYLPTDIKFDDEKLNFKQDKDVMSFYFLPPQFSIYYLGTLLQDNILVENQILKSSGRVSHFYLVERQIDRRLIMT